MSKPSAPEAPKALTPRLLVFAVVLPCAVVVLLVLRAIGAIADAPVWAYLAAVLGSGVSSRVVEPWKTAGPGSVAMHARVAVHVAGVTSVVYLCGWGPALGMAYAFSGFADIEQSGARTWRAALGWSLVGCTVGQALVWQGLAPSMLDGTSAMTIGFLGALVFGIVIRMAGAIEQDRERAQAQLAHQALHDPLTGLANRQLFVDRLTRATERTERRGGSGPALMFLDVDQFKAVNDTFGHQAGDELLTKIAQRLDAVVRTTDTLARLGGDEFVVLCEEMCDVATLDAVMERIRAVFDEPFAIGPHLLRVYVSVGIASASDGLTSAEDLLRAADASMYAAKARRADGTVPPPDEVAPPTVGGHVPALLVTRSSAPASSS